jgi:hypothetical protein
MNLQKTYSSLLAADLAAAEGWYTKLLGRAPDHRPMPTLLHWELSEEGGHSATTIKATIRRWRRSAIRTATSSPLLRRPSDPSRPHDRADEGDKRQSIATGQDLRQ